MLICFILNKINCVQVNTNLKWPLVDKNNEKVLFVVKQI